MLTPLIGSAESPQYSLFRDYIQYSSSVDAYSKMCVKNFKSDSAESELFELVDLLNYEIGLSDKDMDLLKQKYNRIDILGRMYRTILEPLCYITGGIKTWKKK